MKTIFLNPGHALPVPAVHGGAVETLLTMLIEQNEIEHKVRFVLTSVYDQQAKDISSKYKYTKIIYTDKNKKMLLYSLYWRFNKLFHKNETVNQKEFFNCMMAKLHRTDIFIVESFDCWPYQLLKRAYSYDKLWVHLHAELVPDQPMIDAFHKTIAISEYVKRVWMSKCEDEVHDCKVVYNCVDEKKFSALLEDKTKIRESLGFSNDDIVVIYVGRIAPVKGVIELLTAVEKVNGVKLLLVGRMKEYDMDYVKRVQDKVDSLGEKVKSLDYVPNDQLYNFYQLSDIQVVPSMWEEAAGLVAIEGMYSGLPLIVTDSGGLVEYVNEDCALIAKRSDIVNELIRKIELLRDNKLLRLKMGKASSERARLYTKKKYYDDFLETLGI